MLPKFAISFRCVVATALLCYVAGSVGAQTITINGPASGSTGELLQFTAIADGCDPQQGQWFWSLDGGTSGGLTSNAIVEVTWDTPGAKVLSALNPGCAQTVGEATVQINAPGRLGLGADVYVASEGGGQLEIAVVRQTIEETNAAYRYALVHRQIEVALSSNERAQRAISFMTKAERLALNLRGQIVRI